MRKAVGFSPTSMTLGRFFQAAASVQVRFMCNLRSEKVRLLFIGVRLLIKCDFYTRLYGIRIGPCVMWLTLTPRYTRKSTRVVCCLNTPNQAGQSLPTLTAPFVYKQTEFVEHSLILQTWKPLYLRRYWLGRQRVLLLGYSWSIFWTPGQVL